MYIYWKNWKNITQPTLFLEMGQTAPKTAHSGLFSLTICAFEFYPLFTSDISIIYMVNNVKLWTIYVQSVLNYALLICTLSCQIFFILFPEPALDWHQKEPIYNLNRGVDQGHAPVPLAERPVKLRPVNIARPARATRRPESWACMVVGGLHEISMHQPCKIPTLAN